MMWPVVGQAQSKLEKERRIDAAEVPENATRFVDSLFPGVRVKWYFEENLKGNSIEGKLNKNKLRYSVEFDTSGALQDIELVISAKELRKGLQDKMQAELDSRFIKIKIDKIQVQFSGATSLLLRSPLKPGIVGEGILERYEVVFRGKNEDWKLYEATFSKMGDLLSLEEIILKNTDHLAF
jgi:hypothetical protein